MDIKGIWKCGSEFQDEEILAKMEKEIKSDLRYQILIRQTGAMIFEWRHGVIYLDRNIREKISGNYREKNVFQMWLDENVIHEEDQRIFLNIWEESIQNEGNYTANIRMLDKNGYFCWYKISIGTMFEGTSEVRRILGSFININESMMFEKDLQYRAESDSVTKIYNALTFTARIQQLIEQNPDRKFAVIRLDVYKFKYVNERYGIQVGDQLLRRIAHCIIKVTPRNSAFGRIGGDVFGVMIEYHIQDDVKEYVERLDHEIHQQEGNYKMQISYGIYLVEDMKTSVSTMLDRANLALRTVKGNHMQKYAFYNDEIRAKQLEEQWIEEEMEEALREGQFLVYLQPKYSIITNEVIGAEALVRWKHPKEGFLAPYRFIPLFERNGFIIHLDEYVWEETCRAIRRWLDLGYTPVPVSINVSRIHIYDREFEERLTEMVDYYGLPYHLIELELTESIFVEGSEELYERMKSLQKKGFIFSMDDFGAGYSSLNMLKSAPVNILKLDRGFLNDTSATERGRIIVEYVVMMAKHLDLHIIAEGVETVEQVEFLRTIGCDYAQGYYYAKPMPAETFEELVFRSK